MKRSRPAVQKNSQAFAERNWLTYDCPSSVAERLRRRLCNQKIAGSNPAFGFLATPFRMDI